MKPAINFAVISVIFISALLGAAYTLQMVSADFAMDLWYRVVAVIGIAFIASVGLLFISKRN